MISRNRKTGRSAHGRRSIDGMLTSSPRLGERPASIRSDEHKDKAQTTDLGALNKRPEGFHPMRSGTSAIGASTDSEPNDDYLDEPIILDDIKPEKSGKGRHPRARKIFKRTALALILILIVGGLFVGFKAYKTQRQVLAGGGQAPAVCDANVPVSKLKNEGDGRVNILLMGIGGQEHNDGPYLTDTIIVASLDPVSDKMTLLSVPRDLYVKIPGYGSDKINAVYYYGRQSVKSSSSEPDKEKAGIALVDQTLESVLGVPIHYHAIVDFEAFRSSVNALGGVDINVPADLAVKESLWDEGTAKVYYLNVPAGQQHFDGTRALFFARSRYTSVRGDFDRSARQRLTLIAVKEKALSVGTLTNPVKISSLLDSFGNNVYTDFDSGSIKCLSKQVAEVPAAAISSIDLVTPPHNLLVSSGLKGSTQSPKAGTYDFSEIQAYVRTNLRDGFLARENASVAVYNATQVAGMAKTKGDELKSNGYNVTVVTNATNQTNPPNTTVVDLSGGKDKYTRHYLEQRFGVTAVSAVPAQYGITAPTNAKFVIILGNDANGFSR